MQGAILPTGDSELYSLFREKSDFVVLLVFNLKTNKKTSLFAYQCFTSVD